MTPETGQKVAYLICFVVISIAVTGYFVGLQSPMNPSAKSVATVQSNERDTGEMSSHSNSAAGAVLPATHYADMGNMTLKQAKIWQTSLAQLKSTVDPLEEFTITPEQKAFALALREQNRAFNGAPPTVPHPVDQMPAQVCAACHSNGFKTETLRIPKMSHQFLENCTQCHVENNPKHMTASLFRENSFVGLPAPTGGPRATRETNSHRGCESS